MTDADVLTGGVLEILTLGEKVQTDGFDVVVAAPPYWSTAPPVYDRVQPTRWSDGWEGPLCTEPDLDQYVTHLVEVFDACRRPLRPEGDLWVVTSDLLVEEGHVVPVPWVLTAAMLASGWRLVDDVVWALPDGTHEFALRFSRSDRRPPLVHTVWQIAREKKPAEFKWGTLPTQLVASILAISPGAVLNPFCGAGTVGLVAQAMQQPYVGIELDPEFAALARRRLEDRVAIA